MPSLLLVVPVRPGTLPVVPDVPPKELLLLPDMPPRNEFPLEELLPPNEELLPPSEEPLPNEEPPLLELPPKEPKLLLLLEPGVLLPNELLWAKAGAAASSRPAHARARSVSRGTFLRMMAPRFVCSGNGRRNDTKVVQNNC